MATEDKPADRIDLSELLRLRDRRGGLPRRPKVLAVATPVRGVPIGIGSGIDVSDDHERDTTAPLGSVALWPWPAELAAAPPAFSGSSGPGWFRIPTEPFVIVPASPARPRVRTIVTLALAVTLAAAMGFACWLM